MEIGPGFGKLVRPTGRGHVLLVDDEPELLRAYCRALSRAGFVVDTASNGREAIEKFQQTIYDCVVSDISMPHMSGLEFLRTIRRYDLDAPVVLVTGEPTVETAIQAVDYGAYRYLIKPVDFHVMHHVIEQAFQLRRMADMKRQALEMLGLTDKQVGDRAGLEVTFQSALQKLFMVYQPIVHYVTREVVGYEALVRSAEPRMQTPGSLFDAAERLDRLADLTRSLRVLAPAPFQNSDKLLFFNLHVRDLNDETLFSPDTPLTAMASQVILEVTERASMSEVAEPHNRIAQLREMGFRIAIDDLGAGYAGLTSFATLEPDVVKLDMALVRDIHLSPTKQKLVRSMTQLCADMGHQVVAEGVETADERDTLLLLGCELFQGYYFARPGKAFPEITWSVPPPAS